MEWGSEKLFPLPISNLANRIPVPEDIYHPGQSPKRVQGKAPRVFFLKGDAMPRSVLQICVGISLASLVVLLAAFFIASALAWLLGGMGDQTGQQVMRAVAVGLTGLILIDLILLVVLEALAILEDRRQP